MGIGMPIEYNDEYNEYVDHTDYGIVRSLQDKNAKLKERINRDKQKKKRVLEELTIIYDRLLFASAITTNEKDKVIIEEAIQATKNIYDIFQFKPENNK